MYFTIQNFIRITRAVFRLNTVTLIGGHNEQGKSSIALGTRLLLSGEAMPLKPDGKPIAKNQADKLVNNQSQMGMLSIEAETGKRAIEYPSCKVVSEKNTVYSTPVACGLVSPVDFDDKERASFFADLLKTKASQDDLKAAISEAKLSDKTLEELWQKVIKMGWDGCYKEASDKGTDLKRDWKAITGEQWGDVKGEGWRPKGLFPPACPVAELETSLVTAKKDRDLALKAEGVNEEETKKLKGFADKLDFAQEMVDGYVTEKTDLETKQKGLKDREPVILKNSKLKCPECGTGLEVWNSGIEKAKTYSEQEISASVQAHQNWNGEWQKLIIEMSSNTKNLYEAQAFMRQCQDAQKKLSAKPVEKPLKSAAELETEIAELEKDIKVLKDISAASKIHKQIMQNQIIITALAPDGVRQTVLIKGLDCFNAILERISLWGDIRLTDDLEMTWNGFIYAFCSKSIQWRIRTTLQLAIAELDGSCAVVIDEADILDMQGKNDLFKMVFNASKIGISTLVLMTINREKIPKFDYDVYWVEGGRI